MLFGVGGQNNFVFNTALNAATNVDRLPDFDLANDLPLIQRASDELDVYVRAMIDERRSRLGPRPEQDLLSDLIAAEEAGDRLSTDELVGLVEAVLMAGTDTIRNQLVEQVTGMVRWRESVANTFDAGVHEFVEIGGKVLGSMVKRIAPDAQVSSVVSMEDIDALVKEI